MPHLVSKIIVSLCAQISLGAIKQSMKFRERDKHYTITLVFDAFASDFKILL